MVDRDMRRETVCHAKRYVDDNAIGDERRRQPQGQNGSLGDDIHDVAKNGRRLRKGVHFYDIV